MTTNNTTHPPVHWRAPAVTAEGLTKRYGSRTAVAGLSLEIPAGVVAGFIGPNGAGKTTTMAMLLGLVAPTAGTATVLGHPLDDPGAYLGRVGALIEGPAFWPALTGAENLRVVATLAGHDTSQIRDLLELVGLDARGDDRLGQYSFGMKQRLGIAAALLGDPELLVLDEPTNGLDPAGINEMRKLLVAIAAHSRTVLVSSHILSQLEQVCDWLIVIDHGSVVYQGSADEFLGQATPVIVAAPQHRRDLDCLAQLILTHGLQVDLDDTELVVSLDGDDATAVAAALNQAAMAEGIVLAELHVRRPSLESHYLAVLEGGPR